MGDGWKRAVAAARATRKAKPRPTKGLVYAVKTRRTQSNAWMPDECFVRLEGDPDHPSICGWSTEPDAKGWAQTSSLTRRLPKLTEQWKEDYGKSWKLEIRSA